MGTNGLWEVAGPRHRVGVSGFIGGCPRMNSGAAPVRQVSGGQSDSFSNFMLERCAWLCTRTLENERAGKMSPLYSCFLKHSSLSL